MKSGEDNAPAGTSANSKEILYSSAATGVAASAIDASRPKIQYVALDISVFALKELAERKSVGELAKPDGNRAHFVSVAHRRPLDGHD